MKEQTVLDRGFSTLARHENHLGSFEIMLMPRPHRPIKPEWDPGLGTFFF